MLISPWANQKVYTKIVFCKVGIHSNTWHRSGQDLDELSRKEKHIEQSSKSNHNDMYK